MASPQSFKSSPRRPLVVYSCELQQGELVECSRFGVHLVSVCCGVGAMELRRRHREVGGDTTIKSEASGDDRGSFEAEADAVVGAAVRGGSLLMLLALIQVGVSVVLRNGSRKPEQIFVSELQTVAA